ncbi:MAG: hypothetical protein ACK5LK_03775 [Chthoniobacterales bacterium]
MCCRQLAVVLSKRPYRAKKCGYDFKQLQYIRSLVKNIDEAQLAELGCWQASALIEDIKIEQDVFSQELAEEYVEKHLPKQSSGSGCLIAFLTGALIYWLFSLLF